MPIVEVVALPQDPPIDVPAVLGALCVAVAAAGALVSALRVDADNMFVHYEEMHPGQVLAGGRILE